jgi:hypothetical protein
MPTFTANADYTESDANPIRLSPGDEVTIGDADRNEPGWVWATDREDRSGYVPRDILAPLSDDRSFVTEAFDPTVLNVKRGDPLESLRQIHGWHWCRNDAGKEGWVAAYLLRPLESAD